MEYIIISSDDIKRLFVVEQNNVQIELSYPKDIQSFAELTPEDLSVYISGFNHMFNVPTAQDIPVETMVF